jgi:hypothetical protein
MIKDPEDIQDLKKNINRLKPAGKGYGCDSGRETASAPLKPVSHKNRNYEKNK